MKKLIALLSLVATLTLSAQVAPVGSEEIDVVVRPSTILPDYVFIGPQRGIFRLGTYFFYIKDPIRGWFCQGSWEVNNKIWSKGLNLPTYVIPFNREVKVFFKPSPRARNKPNPRAGNKRYFED